MTKIYTRAGDRGETGLIDGSHVPKEHVRVVAYGEVDELCALLGLVRSRTSNLQLDTLLHTIQRDLFSIGAQLADPSGRVAKKSAKARLSNEQVVHLEKAIDQLDSQLPPLRSFILPGGSEDGALLHLARTVCRRAERCVATLHRAEGVDALVLAYVNRLSDLLFTAARRENLRADQTEDRW